jgi:hypothetical protein
LDLAVEWCRTVVTDEMSEPATWSASATDRDRVSRSRIRFRNRSGLMDVTTRKR